VSLIRIAVAVIMTWFPVALRAREKELLKLVDTIPLRDLREGDFDHFAMDLEGHRLFGVCVEYENLSVLLRSQETN